MKNILKIIASDIQRLSINVVAMVVIIGLSVLPCLYAWFNIISNWDPYGPSSTGNLQVAVASDDEGIVLGGLEVNIGDKIITNLEANTTIGWVFTDTSDDAIDGVHSGDYYAALVIEPDFSKNLVSFLGGEIENPKITYYENEKKNAIAPKITSKVKTTIQREVDQAFVSTIAEVLLNSSAALVAVDSNGNLTEASMNKLEDLDNDMKAVVNMLDSYISLIDASQNVMTATEAVADSADATLESAEAMTEGADSAIEAASAAVEASSALTKTTLSYGTDAASGLGDSVTIIMNVNKAGIDAVNEAVTGVIDSKLADYGIKTDSSSSSSSSSTTDEQQIAQLKTAAENAQKAADAYYTANKDAITSDSSGIEATTWNNLKIAADEANTAYEKAASAGSITGAVTSNTQLGKDLKSLQDASKKTSSDIESINKTITDSIENCEDEINARIAEYNNTVVPQIKKTISSADKAIAQTKVVLNYDTSNLEAVAKSLNNYPDMMSQSRESLVKARDEASEMERKLAILTGNIDSLSTDDKYAKIAALLESDPEYLADFIASPVKVTEEPVFPVDTNGSATAPFYIVLSIWVGSLIMSTILKTTVKNKTGMENLKNWQCFFGRYFATWVIGQIQTLITVMGALLYVGIQCEHVFLFWVACSWTATVFSLLLYSFTYSFGNVGEALSVILMVIQVAGSGGTFPIEVLPKVFQYLYALMPFKYAMNAVRECVAGFYKFDYWIDLLCLIPFIAVAIINGLFLYFPMRKLNHQIEISKEKSGILI